MEVFVDPTQRTDNDDVVLLLLSWAHGYFFRVLCFEFF
jgi:hypothetical protein